MTTTLQLASTIYKYTLLSTAVLMLISASLALHAEAFTPQYDNDILIYLPPHHISAFERAGNRSNDMQGAIAQAREHITLARHQSDPRMIGMAQAVLQPWVQDENNVQAQVLQAHIHQYNHRFSDAIRIYDQLLKKQPLHDQALLDRASMHRLRGNYADSLQDCKTLIRAGRFYIGTICASLTQGMNGQLEKAYLSLQRILAAHQGAPESIRGWILINLAEMAERLGEKARADDYYATLITLPNIDNSVRESAAEYFLVNARYADFEQLLQHAPQSDGVLVRMARAYAEQQLPALVDTQAQLESRFERAVKRGESTHLREQAYFYLYVAPDADRALATARENWLQQRESIDISLYVQAASLASSKESLQEIRQWIADTGYEDIRLYNFLATPQGRVL